MRHIITTIFCYFLCCDISISQPSDSINFSNLSREQMVDTLLHLSKHFSSISHNKSYKYATDAMILSENIDYAEGKLKAYTAIGENNILSGNYVDAMEYFFKAMSIAQNKHSRKDIAFTMDKIGDCYQRITDFESALSFYNDALNIYRKLDNRQGVTQALIHIAGTYGMQNECDKSFDYYDKALKIAMDNNDKVQLVIIYNGIGNCNSIIGNYDKSIAYYKQSWQKATEIKDEQKNACLLNNIGNVYRLKKDYNKAIYYSQRAFELSDSIDYKDMTSTALYNLSGIYFEQKDYSRSMDYLNKARKVADELGYITLRVRIWAQYVALYQKLGQLDKANEYYTLLIEEQNEGQKTNNVARIANLQVLYNLAGKQQQLQELELISQTNGLKIKWFAILLIISTALLIIAIFLLYSRNQIIKKQKNDLLNEHNLKHQVEEQESELFKSLHEQLSSEYEKHKREIEKLTVEKQQVKILLEQLTFEKQQTDVQLEQAIKEKKTLEIETAAKNRELVSITMQISQKNEVLGKLRNDILKLKENPLPQMVNDILKTIDHSTRTDKDWSTFLLHFKNVHTDFFDFLQESYPDLTEKDLKQCAYIRMGLSIKEVATLMNISIRAVEKARIKIKTKMKLDAETNLIVYLQKVSP